MNVSLSRGKAERLRSLFDVVNDACSELDDVLAELEDGEVRGDDREDATTRLRESFRELGNGYRALEAEVGA